MLERNHGNHNEEVAFPFGYGGAYTNFEYSNYKVTKNNDGNYSDVSNFIGNLLFYVYIVECLFRNNFSKVLFDCDMDC